MSSSNANGGRAPIPLFDLTRQHGALRAELLGALERVCDSTRFIMGPECKELEESLATYCQSKHAIACASGSDALLLALMAYDIGFGDEVILPSYTFFATASAVWRLGAKPVFVDIDPVTYNLDPDQIPAAITARTKAIIPVHLFGQCADMSRILAIAELHGLAVIEDAAQAIGAEYHGQRAGSMGGIGCFSFYPTKNLGGAGDGGLLTANDDVLAAKLRLLRAHGMEPRYYHQVVGINSRLDTFQAAILNVKLPHLDRWSAMRAANAARYGQLFAGHNVGEWIELPQALPNLRHVWNQYTIRVPEAHRDPLRKHLADHQIGTEIYYPLALHQQACFASLVYRPGMLPETERATKETIALPIFPELRADEQEAVVAEIASYFATAAKSGHPTPRPKFLGQGQQTRISRD